MAKKAQKSNGLLKKSTVDAKTAILFALAFGLVGGFVLRSIYAAPLSKGGGSGTVSAIAVGTVNGVAYDAATNTPAPKLKDALTFKTTIPSMAGWEYPMIAVSCYQDVNGDGTINTVINGPDVVYTWLDQPKATYSLGAYSSIWTLRGGGPATCRADLDAYGWKGGKESVRILATTGDWQAGG